MFDKYLMILFFGVFSFIFTGNLFSAQNKTISNESSSIVSLNNINKICNDEMAKNNLIKIKYSSILEKFNAIKRATSADQMILLYLQLKEKINDILVEINNAQSSQLQLMVLIDQIGKGRDLLPQEWTYVANNRSKIAEFGKQQATMINTVRKINAIMIGMIQKLPLPKEYTTPHGMKMKLLQTPKKDSFYICIEPVSKHVYDSVMVENPPIKKTLSKEDSMPKTNITYRDTAYFVQKLQHAEPGLDYHLPTYEELKIVMKLGVFPSVAVWTGSSWREDWREEDICKRFGVTMITIWDPKHLLSTDSESGFSAELPTSDYQKLGMIVISSVRSGILGRMEKVKEKFMAEKKND